MSNMRPGVKIKFWSPKYTNRPDVLAPGLLRFISATSILSVIGFLVFAVGHALTWSGSAGNELEMGYVAVLHFILPFAAFYTVTSNSPLSRPVIAIYILAICSATMLGKGFLGRIDIDPAYKTILAAVALVAIFVWLFASPRMRYYYAEISERPVPDDLVDRIDELQPKPWLTPKGKAAVAWLLDHLETVVLLGFIAVTIFAYISTV